MAISHVNTTTNTQSGATSATAAKPGGTASGDLLLAFFTCNSQDASPPSGWTEIADEAIEVFRAQVFYKVAGGSEPANYTFSVGASAPLVLSVMCLRGADTSDPIDIDPEIETDLSHSEPYTTPSVTGGSGGRLVYFRTSRLPGSTPVTFSTAGAATERADVGIFSGGSVCYSQGVYLANSEYASSGSKSGLAITASGSESHNIVLTLGVKASGVSGSMSVQLPTVEDSGITMSGSVAYPAVVSISLPKPTMSASVFVGSTEGNLDVQVPITVSVAGSTPLRGSLAIEVPILFEALGETRRFANNVVVPVREERWLIITQEGYYLGLRSGALFPMVISLPLLEVNFRGNTAALAEPNIASIEVFDPTVNAPGAAELVDTYAETYDAEVWIGIVAPAEHVPVTASTESVDQIDIGITTEPGEATAVIEAFDASRGVGLATASVMAFGALIARTARPEAEHVSVAVEVGGTQFTDRATATVTANNATVTQSTRALAEHVSATCIQ